MALKMAVVVDYQNVYLTGTCLWTPRRPREDTGPPVLLAVVPHRPAGHRSVTAPNCLDHLRQRPKITSVTTAPTTPPDA